MDHSDGTMGYGDSELSYNLRSENKPDNRFFYRSNPLMCAMYEEAINNLGRAQLSADKQKRTTLIVKVEKKFKQYRLKRALSIVNP